MDPSIQEKNKIICRLFKLHLKEFYDDIYIPFGYFRNDEWNIKKILKENKDVLFFNDDYLEHDNEQFEKIFPRYNAMIKEIMSDNTLLFGYLSKWTDMSTTSWKIIKPVSYLKSILTSTKYQIISPLYITELYYEIAQEHPKDFNTIKKQLEEKLNSTKTKLKSIIEKFHKKFQLIVDSYVFEYPLDEKYAVVYTSSFVTNVIFESLNFAKELLDLKIYAIHPLIENIIDYYLPLDELNQYIPKEHGGRKYIII